MACQTFVKGDIKVSWVVENGKGIVVGVAPRGTAGAPAAGSPAAESPAESA